MTTVAQRTAPRKAFYCFLYEDHGILTQDAHGAIWFRNSATDALTLVTPEMTPFCMPLGEVGLCETQALADARHGGYAAIATSRAN